MAKMSAPSATAARTALAGVLPASATVAAAFLAVPRHEFLPELGAAQAYQDASVMTKSDADGPVSAGDGANAADSSKSRLAMRLWTLLHAQALLRGTIGGAGGVLNAEDDRWRLAARREGTHRR